MQHPWATCYQRCCMLAGFKAGTAGLDPDQLHPGCTSEGVEYADGVAAPSDAGDNDVRQPSFLLEYLFACFCTDDRLKIAHHTRVRMRPNGRSDQVEGCLHVRDPVADGLIDGILQRAAAAANRAHFC